MSSYYLAASSMDMRPGGAEDLPSGKFFVRDVIKTCIKNFSVYRQRWGKNRTASDSERGVWICRAGSIWQPLFARQPSSHLLHSSNPLLNTLHTNRCHAARSAGVPINTLLGTPLIWTSKWNFYSICGRRAIGSILSHIRVWRLHGTTNRPHAEPEICID